MTTQKMIITTLTQTKMKTTNVSGAALTRLSWLRVRAGFRLWPDRIRTEMMTRRIRGSGITGGSHGDLDQRNPSVSGAPKFRLG
jgi:hypothetical protein